VIFRKITYVHPLTRSVDDTHGGLPYATMRKPKSAIPALIPIVDNLLRLYEKGAPILDASTGSSFTLRAILLHWSLSLISRFIP
jgi:hypothetical protein